MAQKQVLIQIEDLLLSISIQLHFPQVSGRGTFFCRPAQGPKNYERSDLLTSENTSIQTESEFELLSMLFKLKDSLLKLVGLMIRPKIECLKAKGLIPQLTSVYIHDEFFTYGSCLKYPTGYVIL